jgi:hypothetical protein
MEAASGIGYLGEIQGGESLLRACAGSSAVRIHAREVRRRVWWAKGEKAIGKFDERAFWRMCGGRAC